MSWYDYDDSSYFNMHEEILLAYCGCYGVDSSYVELLLEYGYTCDEIEDMLTDHSLLREALKDVKYTVVKKSTRATAVHFDSI